MQINLINHSEKVIVDEDILPLISKIGTLTLDVKGYVRATNHRKYPIRFHRYVAEFYGMCIKGREIHHINGDKLDNRRNNLSSLTSSEHAIIEERHVNAYNSSGYADRKGKPNPKKSASMKVDNPMHDPNNVKKFIGENNPNYKELDLNYIKHCKYNLNLTAKETAKLCNFSQGGFSTVLKTRFKTSWAEI